MSDAHNILLTGSDQDIARRKHGVQMALEAGIRQIEYGIIDPEGIESADTGCHTSQNTEGQNLHFHKASIQGKKTGFIVQKLRRLLPQNDINPPLIVFYELYYDILVQRLVNGGAQWGVLVSIPGLSQKTIIPIGELRSKNEIGFQILLTPPTWQVKNSATLKRYLSSPLHPVLPMQPHKKAGWVPEASTIFSSKHTFIRPAPLNRYGHVSQAENERGNPENPFYYPPPSIENLFSAKGSLMEWQQFVAHPCLQDNWMIACLCLALSAPLLAFTELRSACFYLEGPGAHEILLACGSVAGGRDNGLKYAKTPFGYVNERIVLGFLQSWPKRSKLQRIKTLHNHNLLCLTSAKGQPHNMIHKTIRELLQSYHTRRDTRLEELFNYPNLYMQFNQPVDPPGQATPIPHVWRAPYLPDLLYVMTDDPVPSKLSLIDSKNIRLVVADNSNIKLREFIADQSVKLYGTLLPECISALNTETNLVQQIKNYTAQFMAKVNPEQNLARQKQNVAQRFALAAFAGIKAAQYEFMYMKTKYKLLPWPQPAIEAALIDCFKKWLSQPKRPPFTALDLKKVAEKIYHVLTSGEYCFIDASCINNHIPPEYAGFRITKPGRDYFLIDTQFFNKKLKLSSRDIKRQLSEAKILKRPDSKTFTSHLWIPAFQRDKHGYLINFKKLTSFLSE